MKPPRHNVVGALTLNAQRVLQLVLQDGLSHQEAANALELPLGSVKSLLAGDCCCSRVHASTILCPQSGGQHHEFFHPSKIEESLAGYILGDISESELRELERFSLQGAPGIIERFGTCRGDGHVGGGYFAGSYQKASVGAFASLVKLSFTDKGAISDVRSCRNGRFIADTQTVSAMAREGGLGCVPGSVDSGLSLWQNTKFSRDAWSSPEATRAALIAHASDVINRLGAMARLLGRRK